MTMQCSGCCNKYHGACVLDWFQYGGASCPMCRLAAWAPTSTPLRVAHEAIKIAGETDMQTMFFADVWLQRGMGRPAALLLGLLQSRERGLANDMFYWVLGMWFSILSVSRDSFKIFIIDIDIMLMYGLFMLLQMLCKFDVDILASVVNDSICVNAFKDLLFHPGFIPLALQHSALCLVPPTRRATPGARRATEYIRGALIGARTEMEELLSSSVRLTEVDAQSLLDAVAIASAMLEMYPVDV